MVAKGLWTGSIAAGECRETSHILAAWEAESLDWDQRQIIKLSRAVPCDPVLTDRCQSCSNRPGFPCPVGGTSAVKPATAASCSGQQAAPAHPSLPCESQICPFPCLCQGSDALLGLAGSLVLDRIMICSKSQSHTLFFLLSWACQKHLMSHTHTYASMKSDLDWWHQWQ